MILNFVTTFAKDYDDDSLFDYFTFQFFRYNDIETKFDRVMLNWVIGKAAIEKWNKKSDSHLFKAKEFAYKNGIQNPFRDTKIKKSKSEGFTLGDTPFYNRERKRFYGKKRGLIHCIEMGLFNSELDICKKCPNFKVCDGQV